MNISQLPLPRWYHPQLVTNPFFEPNADIIQAEAMRMREMMDVPKPLNDSFRVLRLHIDVQPDFSWPYTSVDPLTGMVTRYLSPIYRDTLEIPEWWTKGNNRVVWIDDSYKPNELVSVHGGRLSVTRAWENTIRATEWDLANAHLITHHGFTVDFHGLTSRFDMHFYTARANNPYGLPVGAHPHMFIDGPTMPFPLITPESLWHPVHNPKGWWEAVAKSPEMMDESWDYVDALGVVPLWSKHCHRYTRGSNLDPVVHAMAMHHSFLRGGLEAEPLWFPKGMSWRTEYYGVHGPEFDIYEDQTAKPTLDIFDIFDGFKDLDIPGFDLVVYDGQALSHCLLRTLQQAAETLYEAGMEDCVSKMVVLTDCSSNIIGFEEATAEALKALEKMGVRMETTQTLDLRAEADKMSS